MNRELLRSQAQGRRNPSEATPVSEERVKSWTCHHCGHPFASERVFMKHRCREMDRHEELRSPIGQAAYAFYTEWMKLQSRKAPAIETFAGSHFYSSFIKFARHVKKVHLPTPLAFVRSMVDNKIDPTLWTRDNVYVLYMKGYDDVVSPTKQFIQSVDLIMKLAADHEVAPELVFRTLGVDKLLDLVQQRKLSPWFLLASDAFRVYMMSRSEDDSMRLHDGVQVSAMIDRIKRNESTFAEFSKATKELGL